MKRFLKSFLGVLVCVSILMSMLAINTFAAGTIISFSKKSVAVGESVTVTVKLNAEEPIYGVSCIVNYDNNVLNYASGNAVGGAGSVKLVESPSGETAVSYSLTFTAVAAGSCTIAVTDANCSVQGASGAYDKGISGASATLTVTNAALSSNANLNSISVSSGRLYPAFSQSRTSYTVSVNNTVTEFNISAVAADTGSKVEVSGNKTLKLGNNNFTVTVTAPSGATKVYKITVKRSESNDVSENQTSSEETPIEPNSFETNIGGTTYTVATDISSVALFNGFTASTAQFKGQDVPVAVDSNGEYKLYYLKAPDSDALLPYTLNEKTGEFQKVNFITQGQNSYIFAEIPEGKTVGDNFYITSATINGNDISCFANNSDLTTDFYYVYCFADGRYGFYRYDSRENVIQRYPEMILSDSADRKVEPQKDNIFTRFSTLTSNAKLIVIMLVLVLIFAVALVVLLIIKLFNRKEYDKLDDEFDLLENDAFDSIAFNSFNTDVDEETETENVQLEEEIETKEE